MVDQISLREAIRYNIAEVGLGTKESRPNRLILWKSSTGDGGRPPYRHECGMEARESTRFQGITRISTSRSVMESVVRKARRFGVVHLIAGIRFSTKKRKKRLGVARALFSKPG